MSGLRWSEAGLGLLDLPIQPAVNLQKGILDHRIWGLTDGSGLRCGEADVGLLGLPIQPPVNHQKGIWERELIVF